MIVPVLLYPVGGIALVSFLSGVVAGYRGGGSDATELASDDAVSVLTTAGRRAKVPAVLIFATSSLLNAVFQYFILGYATDPSYIVVTGRVLGVILFLAVSVEGATVTGSAVSILVRTD